MVLQCNPRRACSSRALFKPIQPPAAMILPAWAQPLGFLYVFRGQRAGGQGAWRLGRSPRGYRFDML